MKLNCKNIFSILGTSLLLCSARQVEAPIFKTCPNLNQVVHSVINVKEPLQKVSSHMARVASSIVSIDSTRNGHSTRTSGFLISEDGFIITNYFHIKDADQITVTLLHGKELPAALVLKGNSDLDAAILKIEGKPFPFLSLNRSKKPISAWIFSIGSATPGNHFITLNTLKEKNSSKNITTSQVETDPFHSGSPLFDIEGNVIGMHLGSYPLHKKRLCSEPLDKGFGLPLSVLQQKKSQIEGDATESALDNSDFLLYSRHYKCLWK